LWGTSLVIRKPKNLFDKTKPAIKDLVMDSGDCDKLTEIEKDDLLKRLNETTAKRVIAIPDNIKAMTVEDLEYELQPDDVLINLREAFWMEYWAALAQDRKMSMVNTTDGICTESALQWAMKDPMKMAYIMKPIMRYEARLNALLVRSASKVITEILEEPLHYKEKIFSKEGNLLDTVTKFDTTLARLKILVIKQMEDRLRGTPIQRIAEQKQVNVNITNDQSTAPETLNDIEKRIQEIETALGKAEQAAIPAEFTETK